MNEPDLPIAGAGAVTPTPFTDLAAAGRNGWWRYLIGFLGVVATWFVGSFIVLFTVGAVILVSLPGARGPRSFQEFKGLSLAQIFDALGGAVDVSGPASIGATLAAFANWMLPLALVLGTAWLAITLVHKRPWRTVITARERFDWRIASLSFAVAVALIVIATLLQLVIFPDTLEVIFEARPFFLALGVVVVLVPLQVMAEEVVFRGYLLQLVALLTRHNAVRLIVPAIAFVVPHLWSPEIDYGGVWAVLTFAAISVYLTLLAIRGNGLEYAFGFHLGVNLAAFLLLSTTIAPVRMPTIFLEPSPDFAAGAALIVALCALHYWIVFRLAPR